MRYFAGAKAAAGTAEEGVRAGTLAEVLQQVRRTPEMSRVLEVCSFIVDGAPVGSRAPEDVLLRDGSVVECLPPFAGG